MFELAFAIGIFSYSIFLLGLVGLLFGPVIITFTCTFWVAFIFWKRNSLVSLVKQMSVGPKSPMVVLGILYIFIQACINFIGLLGPEIGFDAMWYHLTLPKLYLLYHAVLHFPGGVLYYSDMPRLTEMLYTAGLSFGSDFWARGVHFFFGLLDCIVIYSIGRKFFSPKWAIVLPVIFYSNLVVGWESISGYIDLSRTFFTTTAFLAFLTWLETKDLPAGRQGKKYFIFSAVLVGLTISTKLLSLPDLGIYTFALLYRERGIIPFIKKIKNVVLFISIALCSALPWFAFAYVHTGNPLYPMFTNYSVNNYWQVFTPLFFIQSIWDTFAKNPDPINPLFLAMIPFILWNWKKLWKEIPYVVIFALGGFVAWYVTPQTGGGRYILPYLPVFSVVCLYCIQLLSKNWQKIFLVFIAFVACISLMYRGGAIVKFLPVISGKETKAHFLDNHLQYNLGDFYDIDGYFAKHIKPTDTVLLYGFHNLYYVNFPYILSDWAEKGDKFDFVAVQGQGMPKRFVFWTLIYFNQRTQVRLYSLQNKTWLY